MCPHTVICIPEPLSIPGPISTPLPTSMIGLCLCLISMYLCLLYLKQDPYVCLHLCQCL